jgi:hypothetical protein
VKSARLPLGLPVVLFLLSSPVPLSGQEFRVLPPVPVFPDAPADGMAHQLSLSRITDTREWIGAIGLAAPLLQWGDDVQIGAGATTFNRIIKTPGHIAVSTVDYRVDFPVDVRFDSLRLRAAYGHVSSHYADDGIEQLGKTSISSVRDYVLLSGAWMFSSGHCYASATYNYHNEPVSGKPWHLQGGGEIALLAPVPWLTVYAAVDIKVKQEVAWGSTQSYQLGVRLFEAAGRSIRVSYTHRRGFEERGQVYDQQVIMNQVGVFLDLL